MATTTIQVSIEVRDELRTRGHIGETYDDVIRRLLLTTRGRDGTPLDTGRRPLGAPSPSLFPHRELP